MQLMPVHYTLHLCSIHFLLERHAPEASTMQLKFNGNVSYPQSIIRVTSILKLYEIDENSEEKVTDLDCIF